MDQDDSGIELVPLEFSSFSTRRVEYNSGSGLILGLHPASERRRYKVTPSLIGWAQT